MVGATGATTPGGAIPSVPVGYEAARDLVGILAVAAAGASILIPKETIDTTPSTEQPAQRFQKRDRRGGQLRPVPPRMLVLGSHSYQNTTRFAGTFAPYTALSIEAGERHGSCDQIQ